MIHREKILRKIHYEYYIMNFLWEYFLFLIVVLSILSFIENIVDGLLTRSWIRPKVFVFMKVLSLSDCCSFYIVFDREHHWWIAYTKLNPPEGLCIVGILVSIYCYDCQWSIYCYDHFIVIVRVLSLYLLFFLYCLSYRTTLMDCFREAGSARRPLYFWHTMINLLLWLPIYVIMICVFICCNSCDFVSWIA